MAEALCSGGGNAVCDGAGNASCEPQIVCPLPCNDFQYLPRQQTPNPTWFGAMDFSWSSSGGGAATTRELYFGRSPISQELFPLVSCVAGVAKYGANWPVEYDGIGCPTAGNPSGATHQTFNPFEQTPVITFSPQGTNIRIDVTHRVLILTTCTGVCGGAQHTQSLLNSLNILNINGLAFKQVGVTSTFRWRNPVTLTGIRFANWASQTNGTCIVNEAVRPAYTTEIVLDWNPQYFIANVTGVGWTGSGTPQTFNLALYWTIHGGAVPWCEWAEISSDGLYTVTLKVTLTAQQEYQMVIEVAKVGISQVWTSMAVTVADAYDGTQFTLPTSGANGGVGSVTVRAIRL